MLILYNHINKINIHIFIRRIQRIKMSKTGTVLWAVIMPFRSILNGLWVRFYWISFFFFFSFIPSIFLFPFTIFCCYFSRIFESVVWIAVHSQFETVFKWMILCIFFFVLFQLKLERHQRQLFWLIRWRQRLCRWNGKFPIICQRSWNGDKMYYETIWCNGVTRKVATTGNTIGIKVWKIVQRFALKISNHTQSIGWAATLIIVSICSRLSNTIWDVDYSNFKLVSSMEEND